MRKISLVFFVLSPLILRFLAGCPSAAIHTVTFDSGAGSTTPPQTVTSGSTASQPTPPVLTGYVFEGWYTDAQFETLYEFNQPVTASITLYAKWQKDLVIALEVPKRVDTDVRDSYVLFSITSTTPRTNYHLAVKAAALDKPTDAEMIDGALKRNLGPTAINVLIAQELNAPIIAFAKQHFADNTHTVLGANMHGHFAGSNTGFVMDNDAAGTHAWVNLSVLQPNTMYKLYGMEDGKDTVIDLLSFHTDAAITDPIRSSAENVLRYVDSTLEKDFIEIAVNADEIYIFPHQFRLFADNSIQVYRWNISGAGYPSLIRSSLQFFGDPTDDYSSSLILSKGRDLDSLLASYILLNTAVVKTQVSNGEVVYGSSLALSTVPAALATVFTSVLKPQENP